MITLAQHWLKRLEESSKPAYLLIADLIEEDVASGRLRARDQLPTLRDLANDLELNYTTVARGYNEARRRGLIDSQVGSGTFVRGRSPGFQLRGGSSVEMTMNMPPEPADPALLTRMREGVARIGLRADFYDLLRYQDFGGTSDDRDAGARWLRQRLVDCSADRTLVCPGIHSALVALLSHLVRPGESICVESLSYPGIKAIAAQLGIQIHPLPRDNNGPLATAFEDACKTQHPRAFYCNPTLHNPTTTTISESRREALVDVALRYNVPIIEDDAYVMMPRRAPSPLATLAPELTYYISGFSKCMGAGLRMAYLYAPSIRQGQRIAGALRATTVMASPITSMLATQWINDGTAEAVQLAIREESMARQALAAKHLAKYGYQAQPEGFHLWLPMPKSTDWSPSEFALHLRTQGVGVVASAAFSTDSNPPDAVRVCLGGPNTREDCQQALELIADILEHPHHAHSGVM